MSRRLIVRICALVFGFSFGLAAGFSLAMASESEAADKEGPGPTVVEVPVILVPLATPQGDLVSYAYMLIQLEIPNPNDRWSVEEKVPFIKDAFIREIHRAPNYSAENPKEYDVEGLRQRLFARVQALFDEDLVGSIIFKDIAQPPR